jgi:hypothetical protein
MLLLHWKYAITYFCPDTPGKKLFYSYTESKTSKSLFQYLSTSQKPQNKCSKFLLSFLSKILFEARPLLKKREKRRRRKKRNRRTSIQKKKKEI